MQNYQIEDSRLLSVNLLSQGMLSFEYRITWAVHKRTEQPIISTVVQQFQAVECGSLPPPWKKKSHIVLPSFHSEYPAYLPSAIQESVCCGCVDVYLCACILVCMCSCVCMCACVCMCVHVCACVCMCVHVCACVCMCGNVWVSHPQHQNCGQPGYPAPVPERG